MLLLKGWEHGVPFEILFPLGPVHLVHHKASFKRRDRFRNSPIIPSSKWSIQPWKNMLSQPSSAICLILCVVSSSGCTGYTRGSPTNGPERFNTSIRSLIIPFPGLIKTSRFQEVPTIHSCFPGALTSTRWTLSPRKPWQNIWSTWTTATTNISTSTDGNPNTPWSQITDGWVQKEKKAILLKCLKGAWESSAIMDEANVYMEIPVLAQTMKWSILSVYQFSVWYFFYWRVVGVAVEQFGHRAHMITQGHFVPEVDNRIHSEPKNYWGRVSFFSNR